MNSFSGKIKKKKKTWTLVDHLNGRCGGRRQQDSTLPLHIGSQDESGLHNPFLFTLPPLGVHRGTLTPQALLQLLLHDLTGVYCRPCLQEESQAADTTGNTYAPTQGRTRKGEPWLEGLFPSGKGCSSPEDPEHCRVNELQAG